MKTILEYLPLVFFFIFYKFGDIYWATGALMATTALQVAYYPLTKQKVPTKNWAIFGLIIFFGGLTLFFQDDAFIKWKVTIINLFFALGLIISDKIFNKNLMKGLLEEAIEMPEKAWSKLSNSWAGFFAVCASLNHYVAFNFAQDTWINFKVFGLTGLTIVFTIVSIASLHKHIKETKTK